MSVIGTNSGLDVGYESPATIGDNDCPEIEGTGTIGSDPAIEGVGTEFEADETGVASTLVGSKQ
jgi:hypothetical protein